MSTFHRANFQQIAFTFTSLEPLGLLETAYLEDVNGVDGQVTLTGPGELRLSLLVSGMDSEHERFRAFLTLDGLPDGQYAVSGRARDVVGNEAVFSLPFALANGLGVVLVLPGMTLAGVVIVDGPPAAQPFVSVQAAVYPGGPAASLPSVSVQAAVSRGPGSLAQQVQVGSTASAVVRGET